jgi:hypothetical protein
MSTKATSISKDMDVAKHLSKLHNRYVIVTADKIDVKTLDKDFREYLSRPSNRPLLAWPHVILVTNRERDRLVINTM